MLIYRYYDSSHNISLVAVLCYGTLLVEWVASCFGDRSDHLGEGHLSDRSSGQASGNTGRMFLFLCGCPWMHDDHLSVSHDTIMMETVCVCEHIHDYRAQI